MALLGEMLVILRTGLLTVKVNAADVPPPGVGLKTVLREPFPPEQCRCRECLFRTVLLTKVVVRLCPFPHCTLEVATKFVPVTFKVKAPPPAIVLEGVRVVAVGTGLLMVKAQRT